MKISKPYCLFFFLILVSPAVSLKAADPADGPGVLFFQGQTMPAFAGIMPFFHEESRPVPEGTFVLQTAFLYFNTFRQDDRNQDPDVRVIVDLEGINWGTSFRYSPGKDWELALQAQGLAAFGGFLDPLLSGFHQTFGLPNQSREYFPENEVRWELQYKGSQIARRNGGGTSLTQISGALKYVTPFRGTPDGRLSLKAWVKPPLPVSDGLFLTDIWSSGAGFLYSDSLKIRLDGPLDTFVWGLSGGAAYVSPGGWALPGREWVYQGGGHAGLLSGGWFWGVQAAVFQAPFDVKSYYLGYRSGEIHLGLKAPLGPLKLELALVEEFLTWGTMEVGFQGGLTWTF